MTDISSTLRSAADLISAGLAPETRREEIERISKAYAIGVTPTIVRLIDSADPHDPIGRQFIPDLAELAHRSEERRDPIGDDAFSPVEGVVHRYPDRVVAEIAAYLSGLLPILLSQGNSWTRQPDPSRPQGARRGFGLYRGSFRDLGGDSDRWRSADAVAAPNRATSCRA